MTTTAARTEQQNGQLKARLTVILKADDVVVAEADDALLWLRVLEAINRATQPASTPQSVVEGVHP